jgi:hypothetical protein
VRPARSTIVRGTVQDDVALPEAIL